MRRTWQKQTKQKQTQIPAILKMIIITWVMFCTSCTSKPARNDSVIAAPDPIDSNGELVIITLHENAVFFTTEDGVFLPEWYWRKVFNYIVETQAAQGITYTDDTKK